MPTPEHQTRQHHETEPETLATRVRRISAPVVASLGAAAAPLLSLRVSALDALRVLAPVFVVFGAVLYYFVHSAAVAGGQYIQTETGKPPALLALNISDVTGDAISFSLVLDQTMAEISPINLNLSPTRFHLESSDFKDEDKEFGLTPTPLLGFQFSGFQIPAKADQVNISISSKVDALNDAFLEPFLTETVKYLVDLSNYERNASNAENGVLRPPAPKPITLRHHFTPTFWFPLIGFWKWDIPMWQYHRIDLGNLPSQTNNTQDDMLKKLNVTLDRQDIDTIPIRIPGHTLPVLVYVMNFTLSFSDPTDGVFRLADIGTTLFLTIAHKGVDMLKVHARVPEVHPGRNVGGLQVNLQSVAENGGTQALMDWFGLYAEGIDTNVEIHSLGFDYAVKLGDGRMGWIERMIKQWNFIVYVPGAQEENEFWVRWGWLAQWVVKTLLV
ncbi:hypothetical protein BDR26DRAFT_851020 [Obelidium mucronatum]|nr:hypothetical protein BDR26DRAFT_851020 [Obelidium mucronatum]